MKRRLFNAAALVSLLCAVAAVSFWARSYWRIDTVAVHSASVPGSPVWGGSFLSRYGGLEAHFWHQRLPLQWATGDAGWERHAIDAATLPRENRDAYLRAVGAATFLGFAWKRYAEPLTATGPGAAAGSSAGGDTGRALLGIGPGPDGAPGDMGLARAVTAWTMPRLPLRPPRQSRELLPRVRRTAGGKAFVTRRLFQGTGVASLALGAALIVAWAASRLYSLTFTRVYPEGSDEVTIRGGGVICDWYRQPGDDLSLTGAQPLLNRRYAALDLCRWVRFAYR